jgi:demethylmenaquinone methyltransferase/2-methoxy-6-polyprenyl-1,4-benzoquinol methylase
MNRTGKYYEAGEQRARRVEELFARIAPRYDLINDLQSGGLHRVWKRRLVRLAEVPDGGTVLDLCCGTGDIVRTLALGYPRAALVAGLDFAMPMLRIARSRGAATADPRIVYLRADALRIPVRDATFDRVTVAYGLRNVADLAACLAEARRVLRPGGRFLALEFGKPSNPVISRLYFSYLRAVVPVFGRVFFGDPDTHGYIHDSLLRFPSQAETAGLLRAAGFTTVRVENPFFGIMGIHVADV